jgi:ribosome-associated protein
MPRKKAKSESLILAETIIDGILDKKGKNVISLDLSKVNNSICNFFIICHGTSRTQVEAIADSIEDKVRIKLKEKPWHREGLENAEWVLLDYVDVVAHIFQEKTREFYQLESLWADAEQKKIESEI